jgi:hypothetical protein
MTKGRVLDPHFAIVHRGQDSVKPSKAYDAALEDSKRLHAAGKSFTGKFLRPHAIFIKEIIDRLGVKSILDYGCGRGEQYEYVIPATGQTIEEFWGVKVHRFDPAYPPFAAEPEGQFDLVICTQVLGVIPITDHFWVIDRLYALARKAIYVSERLGEARKEVGDASMRAFDFGVDDWLKALSRPRRDLEVTAAFRRIEKDGSKTTLHWRTVSGLGSWEPVWWPEGIKSLNHKWSP